MGQFFFSNIFNFFSPTPLMLFKDENKLNMLLGLCTNKLDKMLKTFIYVIP